MKVNGNHKEDCKTKDKRWNEAAKISGKHWKERESGKRKQNSEKNATSMKTQFETKGWANKQNSLNQWWTWGTMKLRKGRKQNNEDHGQSRKTHCKTKEVGKRLRHEIRSFEKRLSWCLRQIGLEDRIRKTKHWSARLRPDVSSARPILPVHFFRSDVSSGRLVQRTWFMVFSWWQLPQHLRYVDPPKDYLTR